MGSAGDAAEQVVRISLSGTEYLIRIAGRGVENIGKLIMTAIAGKQKTQGADRLKNMLESGTKLSVYSFKNEDFKKIRKGCREYGIRCEAVKLPKKISDSFDVFVNYVDTVRFERMVSRFNIEYQEVEPSYPESVKPKEVFVEGEGPFGNPEDRNRERDETREADALLGTAVPGRDPGEALTENTDITEDRSREKLPAGKPVRLSGQRSNLSDARKTGKSVRREIEQLKKIRAERKTVRVTREIETGGRER